MVQTDRYARPWARIAATVIDWVVLAAFTSALFLLLFALVPELLDSTGPSAYLLGSEAGRVEYEELKRRLAGGGPGAGERVQEVLGWVTVGGSIAYFWLLTGLRGQTLGKMALRIQVVNGQGKAPGLGRAGLREVAKSILLTLLLYLLLVPLSLILVSALLMTIAGIFEHGLGYIPPSLALLVWQSWLAPVLMLSGLLGLLWMAWNRRKQGWHDKLAGTFVVEKQGAEQQ
jgi:uncharacterized RDD family membrane protein YckC